jgi:hypothetical protein
MPRHAAGKRATLRLARWAGFVRIKQTQVRRPWSASEVEKSLADVVAERGARDPDAAAYPARGARVSWAQYHQVARRLARVLLAAGAVETDARDPL